MKKYLIIIIIAIINTSFLFGQNYPAGYYNLIRSYSDEFNSPYMKTSLWKYNWATYAEETVFDTINNVKYGQSPSLPIGSKVCKIISNYVNPPIAGNYWNSEEEKVDTAYANVVCGQIMSIPHFKYGYYEVKARMPNTNAYICPAFWLTGYNATQNKYTEIDIFENHSGINYHNYWLFFLHYGSMENKYQFNEFYFPEDIGKHICDKLFHNEYETNCDLTSNFHTFGMEWQPEYINFYLDGNLFRQFTTIVKNGDNNTRIPVSNMDIPMTLIFWTKRGCDHRPFHDPNPSGEAFEIDYFRYYKRKPILTNAFYNSSSNSITLVVNTNNPEDTYYWIPSNNLTINGPRNLNTVNISLSSVYNETSITVKATGTNPPATSSNIFIFQQSSGNICTIPYQNNIYVANNINAPCSGCTSTIIPSGKNIIFVSENEINLNPGFEVQLGATFEAFTH